MVVATSSTSPVTSLDSSHLLSALVLTRVIVSFLCKEKTEISIFCLKFTIYYIFGYFSVVIIENFQTFSVVEFSNE